jgi:hypothetical protein
LEVGRDGVFFFCSSIVGVWTGTLVGSSGFSHSVILGLGIGGFGGSVAGVMSAVGNLFLRGLEITM